METPLLEITVIPERVFFLSENIRKFCKYSSEAFTFMECVESFFASLKKEKIYRRRYETMEEVKKDIFWYIEMFYNRKRRHSALEYMTPVEYRLKYDEKRIA